MAKDKAIETLPAGDNGIIKATRKVRPTNPTLVLCNRMCKIMEEIPEPRRAWVLSFLQDSFMGPVNPMEQAS